MRPTIDSLFDSTIRLWRPVSFDDTLGVEQREYLPMATVRAVMKRSVTATQPADGGMSAVGKLRWYGRPDIDVQRRDVCEVIAGPDAGHSWEVDADPVHPRGHHTQVDCIEWHGVLSPDETS